MRAIPQPRDRESENRHKFEDRLGQLVLVDESNVGSSVGAWLLDRVDDVATDLFVALQL